MIRRQIKSAVEDALSRQAAVAIIGPRQVGKTTLALEIAKKTKAIYLDLEDQNDRNKLSDPVLFLDSVEDNLVILDEIHKVPELFQTLRGVIDRGRRRQKGKRRFLILGSASIDLLKQSGESLAGRIAYIFMTPFSVLEIDPNSIDQKRLWLRGGFPDSYLATSDVESYKIRKDFLRTYLEREIPMFGPRIPANTMERLWTMLANSQGTILNASEIGRALETSTQSVTRYIDLLCDLLLVRRLQPFHANVRKRLVKSPKVYVRDSGLVHALLGLSKFEGLVGHPVVGNSWEGFVIENLLSNLPWGLNPYYYRTAAGAEVDLVIEHSDRSIWALEIKRGLSSSLSKGFHHSIEDLKPTRSFVVHSGADRFPISKNTEAIGLAEMCSLLFKLN